ncbi:hypothetical protein BH20ACT17_BH20ACT17_18110 [soil metagenome]
MVTRPAGPTEGQMPASERHARSETARSPERPGGDQASSLARSALTFAARCHAGQWRESDGAPFIAHPSEVARLLRDSGCSSVVVVAGLLHDVVANTDVSLSEVTARFGADVAELVQAVTDDCVGSYRQREQVLREQVRSAGGDAALLFAADKIAEVRELADQARSERARFDSAGRALRARERLERYQQMRFEHYQASLTMLQRVAPRHALVKQLARELDTCPLVGQRAIGG